MGKEAQRGKESRASLCKGKRVRFCVGGKFCGLVLEEFATLEDLACAPRLRRRISISGTCFKENDTKKIRVQVLSCVFMITLIFAKFLRIWVAIRFQISRLFVLLLENRPTLVIFRYACAASA